MSPPYTFVEPNSKSLFTLTSAVIALLSAANETLGVAESLTAGGVMAALTSVPGASAVFRGGVVSYATSLKQSLLDVPADLIAREGVIHPEVAVQMARGARKITSTAGGEGEETTWGIGTTGVAGPAEQDGKPVGMVYIGIASAAGESWACGPFGFTGSRERIREATVLEAVWQMHNILVARQNQRKEGN